MFHEYTACFHIHFPLRAGKKMIEFLAGEAEKSGVDVLLFTQHTPKESLKKQKYGGYFGLEGYYGKTLVLTGEEADENSGQNHLLVYGPRLWTGKTGLENVIPEIKKSRGLSFIAHPFGKHKIFLVGSDHRWRKNTTLDFDGIEIWSLLFDLVQKRTVFSLPFRYLRFPANLSGPEEKTLEFWDACLKKSRTVGICGLDIHDLPPALKMLDFRKVINYGFVFRVLRNHILCENKFSGDFRADRQTVLDALKKGRVFIADDFLQNSGGFFFGGGNREKTMGDCCGREETILVKTPLKAEITLKKNGKTILSGETDELKAANRGAGIYRAEVFLNGRPWIFTNPVYGE